MAVMMVVMMAVILDIVGKPILLHFLAMADDMDHYTMGVFQIVIDFVSQVLVIDL